MYFDTHAHYDDRRFDGDRHELLGSMGEAGLSLILNSASSLISAKVSLELADRYPFVYASVGVHPHDSKSMSDSTVSELEALLAHPKALAVGEIGLDFHHNFSPPDVQRARFREQMELARRVGKPVIIHEREAINDTLDVIRDFRDLSGVFHCFSGSWETAKIILDMGWYLSFTGVITFRNARRALEVLEKMPADRIMVETDCPYLTPEPYRGKRNSSLYLPHVVEKVAQVRNVTVEEAAALTMENGKRFFGIPSS
ncbi:MAG: TatD family hydrolase [Oscillospiraceae bacterium]|nr:TatD family hydrolase [Oscillospiraceae bacterium]